MYKRTLTIGLFDRQTKKQEITTETAKEIIVNTLIEEFKIFAFTAWDCLGVYQMEDTGEIVREPSIRLEIATDEELTNVKEIIAKLTDKLNQESIMMETAEDADIKFINNSIPLPEEP